MPCLIAEICRLPSFDQCLCEIPLTSHMWGQTPQWAYKRPANSSFKTFPTHRRRSLISLVLASQTGNHHDHKYSRNQVFAIALVIHLRI